MGSVNPLPGICRSLTPPTHSNIGVLEFVIRVHAPIFGRGEADLQNPELSSHACSPRSGISDSFCPEATGLSGAKLLILPLVLLNDPASLLGIFMRRYWCETVGAPGGCISQISGASVDVF